MPTKPEPLVFVSSTSDLSEERHAVRDALAEHPVGVYLYEVENAGVGSPREHLKKVLKQTDVYVGLFGNRYGSVLPGCEKERSIVEWEFDKAYAQEGTVIFALANVDPALDVEPRQAAFLERVSAFDKEWLKPFSSIDELKRLVVGAYNSFLTRFYDIYLERKQRGEKDSSGQPKTITRRRTMIAVVCAVSLLGVAAATLLDVLTERAALGLLCVIIAVAISSILLNDQ